VDIRWIEELSELDSSQSEKTHETIECDIDQEAPGGECFAPFSIVGSHRRIRLKGRGIRCKTAVDRQPGRSWGTRRAEGERRVQVDWLRTTSAGAERHRGSTHWRDLGKLALGRCPHQSS
jgi:hypothetical protein